MARPTVVLDLANSHKLARDLVAGGVFVPGCTLELHDECDVLVRGAHEELSVPARVVWVDGDRGAGLQLMCDGSTMERIVNLAKSVAEPNSELSTIEIPKLAVLSRSRPRRRGAVGPSGSELDEEAVDPEVGAALDTELARADFGEGAGTHAAIEDLDAGSAFARAGGLLQRDIGTAKLPNAPALPLIPLSAATNVPTEQLPPNGPLPSPPTKPPVPPPSGSAPTEMLPATAEAAAAEAAAEAEPQAEQELDAETKKAAGSLHERLRGLTLVQQVKLAHGGDVQERILLERMYGKNVWEPLLRNPRLTAPEVARLARMGTLPRVLIELIVNNGGWLQMGEVRRALLANPRLGTDQALRILRLLPKHELKLAATQTAYPFAVRDAARKLIRD